ncbi:hypothetical protein [Kaistella sp.]|uniref:hypothetical protein n=1 Tax=Kaistella sp. TaxID=2782235 RepID=UPI002F938C40
MKFILNIALVLLPFLSWSQNFETLKLNLPKNNSEPENVYFKNDTIFLDDKKCFSYMLSHNVEKNGLKMRNYYEIKDKKGDLLFTGNISKTNEDENWTDRITFVLLGGKIYKNAAVVGRDKLILNLVANQVIGSDCSIHAENLKLFFDQSNENIN